MIPSSPTVPGLSELVSRLESACGASDPEALAEGVKHVLVTTTATGSLALPEPLRRPIEGGYARRLLHLCPQGRWSLLAMIWGPGQGTPVHDHSGMWCVEGVLEGEIEVTQFELLESRDGRCRFRPEQAVRALPGSAGALIPPFEYHTIANASGEAIAITLHVYGGEMTRCSVFEPTDGGWFVARERVLGYH